MNDLMILGLLLIGAAVVFCFGHAVGYVRGKAAARWKPTTDPRDYTAIGRDFAAWRS